GTDDLPIWQSVYEGDEYTAPMDLRGGVVIDVGLHVGSFACLCKRRGAAEVWGVEADPDNLSLALANFAAEPGHGLLQAFHAAAWRADRRGDAVAWVRPQDATRTAHGGIRKPREGDTLIPTLAIDDLIKWATDFYRRRIRLLKIDCE